MDVTIDLKRIPSAEKMELNLRNLYESFGYAPYKMSKFEEYELYAHNKDFLGDGGIMTFTNNRGRLMALKPDVTLSIVKNSKGSKGTQRVYYRENVYRASAGDGEFREIQQCGIECIGDISSYDITEVLLLALKSLEAIGHPFKLEISHMGILSSLIDEIDISADEKDKLLSCIKRKNSSGIREIAGCVALADAIELNGKPSKVISALKELCTGSGYDAAVQLENAVNTLSELGYADNIGIDLSVVNDMNYYRSLVFKGYIDCVPESVLVGGKYDDLVKKMGRDCGAIGFALSLNKLSSIYRNERQNIADILLVYDNSVSDMTLLTVGNALRDKGNTVIVKKSTEALNNAGRILYVNSDGSTTEKEG